MRNFMQKLNMIARNHDTPHVDAIAEDGDLLLELGKECSVKQVMTCMLTSSSPVFADLLDEDNRKSLPSRRGIPTLKLRNVDPDAMGTLCRMLHLKSCRRPNSSAKLADLSNLALSYGCLAAVRPHLRLWLREHVAYGSDARSRNPTCLTQDIVSAYLLTDHDEFQRATTRLVLCRRGGFNPLRSTASGAGDVLPPELWHVLERKRADVQASMFLSLRKLLHPLTQGRARSFREDKVDVVAGQCTHEKLLQRLLDLETVQKEYTSPHSVLDMIKEIDEAGLPGFVEWSSIDGTDQTLHLRESFAQVTDSLCRMEESGLCLLKLKGYSDLDCRECGRNAKKRKSSAENDAVRATKTVKLMPQEVVNGVCADGEQTAVGVQWNADEHRVHQEGECDLLVSSQGLEEENLDGRI